MDLGLAGRSCAVTGASRGIGRETALALCAEGGHVLLVGRDERRHAVGFDDHVVAARREHTHERGDLV